MRTVAVVQLTTYRYSYPRVPRLASAFVVAFFIEPIRPNNGGLSDNAACDSHRIYEKISNSKRAKEGHGKVSTRFATAHGHAGVSSLALRTHDLLSHEISKGRAKMRLTRFYHEIRSKSGRACVVDGGSSKIPTINALFARL